MSKKIYYVTPVNVLGSSAAAKRILANSYMFSHNGYSVNIFSSYLRKPKDSYVTINSKILLFPVSEINPNNQLLKLISYFKFLKIFFNKLKKVDIKSTEAIILYGGYSVFIIPLLIWTKTKKIKLVFDAVEWYTPKKKYHWFFKPYYWNTEICNRFLISKTKNVICISSRLENYFKVKAKTFKVPPLFIDKAKLKSTKNDVLTIAYAGSPGSKDLLHPVFEAIKILNKESVKIRLNIVGMNSNEVIKYLDQDYIPNYIKTYGYVELSKAQEIVRASDFSFLIRKRIKINQYGFPTKAVESLSLGTPLICNITSDLGDYLIDGVNSIIIPETKTINIVEGFRRSLDYSLEQYLKISESAINLANDKFHYSAIKINLKND